MKRKRYTEEQIAYALRQAKPAIYRAVENGGIRLSRHAAQSEAPAMATRKELKAPFDTQPPAHRYGGVNKWTPRARARFLRGLERTGCVSIACRAAGFGRTTAYKRRGQDEGFRAEWDEALALAADRLEAEARRRAVEGTLRPVYQGGRRVGSVRLYSDRLLELLLRAHRPGFLRGSWDRGQGATGVLRVAGGLGQGPPR